MIACLGEHLSEREGGKTEEVVTQQMKAIAGVWGWGGVGRRRGEGMLECACMCVYVHMCEIVQLY